MTHLRLALYSPVIAPPPRTVRRPSRIRSQGGAAANTPSTATAFSASKWADRLLSDFQFLPPPPTTTTSPSDGSTELTSLAPPRLAPPERDVSIPLHFYQVLGAEAHFLGDGIRRAYEARVSKPPQYGYSQDALISRRQILQAACETLADPRSRREYNEGLAEDEVETIFSQVPWDKVKTLYSHVHYFIAYDFGLLGNFI